MAEEAPTIMPAVTLPEPEPEPVVEGVQQQEPVPQLPAPVPIAPTINHQDSEMAEAIPSPVPQPPSTTSTPAPQRTATPTRNVNGNVNIIPPMPPKASSHGAPARRYLNEKVTGVLLEGMKRLAAEQPEDPLRVLGEFLLQRSKELEGI